MKHDEPFDPKIKSEAVPAELVFRIVNRDDRDQVIALMQERNPHLEISKIQATTDREMDRVETDPNYKLYVAELSGQVVGLCRFAHTQGFPAEKKVFPSPDGWYGLGILVHPQFRRRNIARFLSARRIDILKSLGAKELYSSVDSKNLTSVNMHINLGFKEMARAPGFLHVSFPDSLGILFKLEF